jgi:YgiT-type zinc finger domain-containing protein
LNDKEKPANGNNLEDLIDEEAESCEACGGTLKAEKVNLEEFEGGKLYLMENVAAFVCEQCGEVWVPEPIIEEFEKMMETAKHRSTISKPKRLKKKAK